MDMSLPSYSAISDAKNTKESLSSLVIEPTYTEPASKQVAAKKREPMKGPSMSSVLPSMNKQGPKKKAPTAKAAPVEKEDWREKKVQIVEMDMPTYSGATDPKEKSPFSL